MNCAQLAGKIEAQLQTKDRCIVLVAGIPGAGKTTWCTEFVRKWQNDHAEIEAVAVSMDGFHYSREYLKQMPDPIEAFRRRGAPFTFDVDALLDKLLHVKSEPRRDHFWPTFDHAIGDPIADGQVIPAQSRVIVVEGNYLMMQEGKW